MISSFFSICSFVLKHPGLLLVLLGVVGEVVFDWPETHGPKAWVRRLSSAVLVVGLVVEFFEAAKSDKEVASLTLQTTHAQKQIAEISLEVAKANQSVADAQERAAKLEKEAAAARLELEQLKIKTQPRTLTQEQRKIFMASLASLPKRVVKVISLSGNPEPMQWATQIRKCLNETGFSDPAHAAPEYHVLGYTPHHDYTTCIMLSSEAEGKAFFENQAANITAAFVAAQIRVTIGFEALMVNAGEVAILVLEK